ncbi:RHS repeat domain-containing protein [Flavobacterium eburneipallidum]|uniref:RHS repeat domain-containing protein n=1 Tax=Flavobacterium eburneipallidum TaxID=3003263 RepID=UPI0024828272|nr:RHS repeat domain-containing protein [Flavobacterium eburneipallidum]
MKNKLNFMLILFYSLLGYSQNLPKIIQPTPEAANLSKYAEIPVSLFTGKSQVEFPLYTLKCGNLELPISLSYYASGIKVEDYSTWAGIGWALNAGGVITKTDKGPGYAGNTFFLSQYLPLKGTTTEQFNALVTLDNHNTDPDTYNFNFLKHSGSFQIKNNKAVFRKHVNLKVEFPNFPNFDSITITDDNGIKYYFDEKSSGGFQTDYYLVKIESSDKLHTINFEYIAGDWYGKPPHNSVFYTLYPSINYIRPSSNNFESRHSGYLLSKIYTSSNNSVVFVKKDILQPKESAMVDTYRKALDYINIYDNNKKIVSFHFNTNNVKTIKPYEPNANFPLGYPAYKVETEMNYRLYLDGFDKIDSTGEIIESYGFDYYGRTGDGKDSLPNRYSLAQDLEGYYNGEDNNMTLIPSFNQNLHLNSDNGLHDPANVDYKVNYNNYLVSVDIPGANRNPNLDYMGMGMLKSIKYPTGGSAKFYYSQIENPLTNEPFFGLKIDKTEYLNSDGALLKRKKYIYQNPVLGYHLPSNWHYTLYNGANLTPYPDFNFFWGHQYKEWNWAIELSPDPAYEIAQNAPKVGYGIVNEIEEGNGGKKYEFSIEGASYNEATDYDFAVNGIFDGGMSSNLNTTSKSWPTGPIQSNNWKLGTLLHETTYNQNNDILAKKSYNYTYPILDTIYGLKVHKVGYEHSNDPFYFEYNSFFYHQYSNLSVWERLDSVTETLNGVSQVTSYNYDNYKQISQIKTTKSNGDLFTTNFKYSYNYPSAVYFNMVSRNMLAPIIEKTEMTKTTQTSLVKTNYSFWKREENSINLVSGQMVVEKGINNFKTETFSITEPAQLKINVDLWRNGDGYFVLEGYGPPQTYHGSGIVDTTLNPGNYTLKLSFPESTFPETDFYGTADFSVEIKDFKNNMIASNDLTDCIYPLSVEVKKGEDPIETRLNYNSYDSKGNIASVSKTNDLEIIYIWGYKQTQPVAKIENATQAQITALSLNMTLINDSSTTDSAMQTELQKLRTGLPHAMVTTYTYKPLIGISTITDPKGDTVTYNYDAFGRLQNVKDKDGNILSENEYHYKN